jgi:hypothetical protein
MPKYMFPLTEEKFLAALTTEGKKMLASVLGAEDATFAFSCMKLGWTNKQFHKAKQDRDREDLKKVRALLKKDPSLAKRMEAKIE